MTLIASQWAEAGLPADALDHLDLPGRSARILPSTFEVDALAQASIALAGLAAAALHHLRGAPMQDVSVDRRHAAWEFWSERVLTVDGVPAPNLRQALQGLYPTADGHVRLHTMFPHHRAAVLRVLGCAEDRTALAAALSRCDALAFEAAVTEAGGCVAALRTDAEWWAHPQAVAIEPLPLVEITRIGEAPAPPRQPGARPLAGIRVLDLTRVIAGPICGRTLAAHGADVLAVTAPHLPHVPPLVIDNNRGKRSTALDLDTPDGHAALTRLLRGADVFVQGYRRGSLARRGLDPAHTTGIRPGLIHASLNAYGRTGPWAGKRGYDSLVQTVSGLNADEGGPAGPRELPAQALDHATGHLLAFGIIAALHRRAREGGSWHVQVSLARTAQALRALGRNPGGTDMPPPDLASDLLETTPSGFGRLTALRHAARMSLTPAVYTLPSRPLGSSAPEWA